MSENSDNRRVNAFFSTLNQISFTDSGTNKALLLKKIYLVAINQSIAVSANELLLIYFIE